jgi:hypothetical protein
MGGRSVCKYVTVQGDAVREDGGHTLTHSQPEKVRQTVPRERFKGKRMGGK